MPLAEWMFAAAIAQLSELDRKRLALEFEINVSTIDRWARGTTAPHPLLQEKARRWIVSNQDLGAIPRSPKAAKIVAAFLRKFEEMYPHGKVTAEPPMYTTVRWRFEIVDGRIGHLVVPDGGLPFLWKENAAWQHVIDDTTDFEAAILQFWTWSEWNATDADDTDP